MLVVPEESEDDDFQISRAEIITDIQAGLTEELDPSTLMQTIEMARHAPASYEGRTDLFERIAQLIAEGERIDALVLAADIRKSTFLMKEAVDFRRFGDLMDIFIKTSKRVLRNNFGGWFDKFTGDGFLCYWLPEELEDGPSVIPLLKFCGGIHEVFGQVLMDAFRENSHNFPAGVGLSFGIDYGPCQLVMIENELTIIGHPVVGAARMVNCAGPGETLMNGPFGAALYQDQEDLQDRIPFEVTRELRGTKEYDEQEVYVIEFTGEPDEDNPRFEI